MRLLDLSFDDPAENLALDEVLLRTAEVGGATLRFWESPAPFVVIGTGQALAEEVYEAHCVEDAVPFLRRCTAGGCVLQGPGCLNFTLALPLDDYPEVRALHASYLWILEHITGILGTRGVAAVFEAPCDLAVDGAKVSGNAQRRRSRAILHHGTLLHAPDLAGMERYLREPKRRPEYRGTRGHRAFVGRLPFETAALREVLREAFQVNSSTVAPDDAEMGAVRKLAEEKYRCDAWTRRR